MVLSRFLKRSGSIPAEEQTALKSLVSSNRNCSALRLKLSGPHIHSSKDFVITARQSLSSAVPRSLICRMELLNMVLAPSSKFCSAECSRMCRYGTTIPSNSVGNRGVNGILAAMRAVLFGTQRLETLRVLSLWSPKFALGGIEGVNGSANQPE